MTVEINPEQLTAKAQSGYAESMVNDSGQENAARGLEQAQDERTVETETQNEDTNAVSPDATFLGKKLEDLGERLAAEQRFGVEKMRQQGNLSPDVIDFLEEQAQNARPQMSPKEVLNIQKDRFLDPNASAGQINDLFSYFKALAQNMASNGLEGDAIASLARAGEDIALSQKRNLISNMLQDKDFENKVEQVFPASGFGVPGSMVEGDNDEDLLNMYYPPSLEDVGERAEQVVSPEFKSGGKYEIMHKNEDGTATLKPENLLRWMRKQWLVWGHQFSPDNPQVSPFGTIQILSYTGGIQLEQMVTNERYWQKRVVRRNKDTNEIVYRTDRYGGKKIVYDYEQSSEYDDLREAMIMEFWLWGKAHTYDATMRPVKGADKAFFEKAQQLYAENAWLQGRDRLLLAWKLPATSGDTEGEFGWMGKEKAGKMEDRMTEGRLGRAHRQADSLYFRLGHVENMNDKENVFFERLGEDGKKEFFRSMIRRGLEGMYKERAIGIMEVVKKADLTNVDLAEVLFRSTASEMKELFTGNENAMRAPVLAKLLGDAGLTIDRFAQQAVLLREGILGDITTKDPSEGAVGFGDAATIRDLFRRASGDMAAMEDLGLRFIDLQLETPQGEKWTKDPSGARKAVRKELNLFNQESKPKPFEKALRYAIQDAIGKVNNLDADDAEYAENFAFAKVYWTLSSGYNDTSATGFDGGTKAEHMMAYRENNMDNGKNFVGNAQNLYGVKRTILPFWMAMYGYTEASDGTKKKGSLLSVMENGFTNKTRPPKASKESTLKRVNFDRTIEARYANNHLAKGYAFYERHLKGPIFDLEKYVKVDGFGRVQTNPDAMADIMSKINNEIRYTFNQMQFDFEDEMDAIEIVWVQRADGKMTAEPRFVREKLKDILFDKEIVNMGMYERRMFTDNWVNKRIGEKDIYGEDMLNEYSRNVLAWLLGKEILEHRLYNSKDSSYNHNIWELDMIRAIEGLFANIPMGGFDAKDISLFNKNKKLSKRDSFFNRKEFKKIRLMGNAGYGKLWLEALRAQAAESAWKGGTNTTKKFLSYIFQDMWNLK